MTRFTNRIKRIFIDLLGFSRTETNGFLVLLIIASAIGIFPRFFMPSSPISSPEDMQAFTSWAKEVENSITTHKIVRKSTAKPLSTFDPNTSDKAELISSGLPDWLASRIIAYRSKGGTFREPNDLSKMYGLSDSLFKQLRPYVVVRKSITDEPKTETSEHKPAVISRVTADTPSVDINLASSEQLQEIRGLGPVLSKRIVKYRELLGGFCHFQQLEEVYGLNPEVIERITDRTFLHAPVRTLNVNKIDSIQTLARHPYIDYKLARSIINYRKVHGIYQHHNDLKEIKILSDSLYLRIAPYLSL